MLSSVILVILLAYTTPLRIKQEIARLNFSPTNNVLLVKPGENFELMFKSQPIMRLTWGIQEYDKNNFDIVEVATQNTCKILNQNENIHNYFLESDDE